MEDIYLMSLGIVFCLTSILYLALSPEQRDILLCRIRLRGRRASSAGTPPRSLSPEKKATSKTPCLTDYINIFPPSRREAFGKILQGSRQADGREDINFDTDMTMTPALMMPFDANYMEVDESKYTPTGLSSADIRLLGDFPDYAELSGVPLPEPYQEFNIEKAMSRPYRPFRWAYHQTMSLSKLETNWWLEIESNYKLRISQRKRLYEQHGKEVLQSLPGSELACKELMEMALQFLVARYPHYFSLSDDRKMFTNDILGITQDVRSKAPLLILLDNVPEDFAIVIRDPDNGHYCFRAGMICSALGWNVGTKIGLQLHEVHAPIPDYKEKMQFSMDRFFSKMPTEKPIQRGSWGLEIDTPLYMPPGDPHEKYRESQSPDTTLDRCHLRVDWQTLRRLPLSGAIVFNFNGLFTPVTELRDEPFIPAIVHKNLKEGKASLMKYKNTWHVEHVCMPALEGYAKEQVQQGLVPENWEVRTLNEQPYFPGWEEKWHRQQGY